MKPVLVFFVNALLLIGVCAQTRSPANAGGEPPSQAKISVFSNDDVLKLTAAGLGDDVVTAKINAAVQTSFQLETDDLVFLKKSGVGQNVISAMIKRGSGTSTSVPSIVSPSAPSFAMPMGFPGSDDASISLVAKDGTTKLSSMQGHHSTTYAVITVLMFMDYPELKAAVRTHDPRPYLTLRSNKNPQGRYFLVRCEPNPKDNNRSVKLGRSGMFTHKEMGAPDSDWTIPYEVKAIEPGVWRIDPKRDLPPGEYGLSGGFMGINMEMYDFGVDG